MSKNTIFAPQTPFAQKVSGESFPQHTFAQVPASGGTPQQTYTAAPPTITQQGLGMLEKTVAKDGVGWGFGLGIMLLLGAIAWFIRDLTLKLDPANVAIVITRHIQKTEKLLNDIDTTTESSNSKIDRLLIATEDIKDLHVKSRELGLEMSGELTSLKYKLDDRIKAEMKRTW